MPTRIFRLFGAIFLAVAVVMLVIAAVILVRQQQFQKSSVTATGTVEELVVTGESCDDDGGDCEALYAPRVSFTPENGSPSTFVSRRSSAPPAFSVGNTVVVRYQVTDLTTARIDSAGELQPGWVVGGIGALCFGFGVVWLVIARISRRSFSGPVHRGAPSVADPSLTVRADDGRPETWEPPSPGEYQQPPTTPLRDDQPPEPPGDYR